MNILQTKNFQLAIYQKGNPDSSKLALVLPGRLDTKDYPHMRSHVDYLASRGYLALSFDPPGTWGSPGDISLYTMTNYLRAINELIEYFGNKLTFVFGHSRGGSMAMLAGVRNQYVTHFISCMGKYSYAPKITKLRAVESNWKELGYLVEKRDVPNLPGETKVFNLPYHFYEDSTKYNMLEGLRCCNKPKLFIYGSKDTTVDPEGIKKAYEESAAPKELFSLDSDHNYRLHQNLIEEVNTRIGVFLDNCVVN